MGCDDTPEDLRERIAKLSQEVGDDGSLSESYLDQAWDLSVSGVAEKLKELADAQAELARLRATVDAVRTLCDERSAPGDWHPTATCRRVLRRALAAAPTPTEEDRDA